MNYYRLNCYYRFTSWGASYKRKMATQNEATINKPIPLSFGLCCSLPIFISFLAPTDKEGLCVSYPIFLVFNGKEN